MSPIERDAALPLPPPPPTAPVRPSRVGAALAAEAARSLVRLLAGRRRDRDAVADEYDDGYWRDVREDRRWLDTDSIDAFVRGTGTGDHVRRVGGRAAVVDDKSYYGWRAEILRALLDRFGVGSEIIELGSGYGLNLFTLAADDRWRRLIGLDISRNGVAAASEIAAHFRLDRLQFGSIDLTDPSDPGFRETSGRTVLTYYALEQIAGSVGSVLDTLLAMKPARVIHVESGAELLPLLRPHGLVTRLYVRSKGYQRTLAREIKTRAAAGTMRVVHREVLGFGPTLHNDPMILVWEPSGGSGYDSQTS